MVVLSILLPYIPKHRQFFKEMLTHLKAQVGFSEVEIITDNASHYNIGIKRQKMLERATGDYVVHVDVDDLVAHNYISLILEACKHGSDCIGISGIVTTNGLKETQWHISKEYGSWYTEDNIHYRTPNHISPVKRELALKAGFPPIKFGEDAEYSRRVFPYLKTETKIEGNIYWYRYTTKGKK